MRLAVIAALCVSVLFAGVAQAQVKKGDYAKDIEAKEWANTDEPISLHELRGMTVVVFFWVSWHPGGEYIAPLMNILNSKIGKSRGVYVLGLFLDTYKKIPPEVKLADRSGSAYIAPLDSACLPYAITVAQQLRAGGKAAMIGYDCRKIGRQIETASKRGFPYAIILGKKEVDAKSVTLKNLQSGEQQTVPLSDVVDLLK